MRFFNGTNENARIEVRSEGAADDTANIRFFTKSSLSALNERMRIAADGDVGIGLTPTTRNNTRLQIVDGIGFPATQVPSTDLNTLDDYEEGTWTPIYAPTTGTFTTLTYTANAAQYTKIGNLVTLTGIINTSNVDVGTASGNLRIEGLPFTAAAGTPQRFAGSLGFMIRFNTAFARTNLNLNQNTNFLLVSVNATTAADSYIQVSDMLTGATASRNWINFSITYRVD